MSRSNALSAAFPPAAPRRLVLATAFMLAFAIWAAPRTPIADAQESPAAKSPASTAVPAIPPVPPIPAIPAVPPPGGKAAGEGRGVTMSIDIRGKDEPDAAKDDAAAGGTRASTVVVRKGDKTVTISGVPGDREAESIASISHMEPVLGTMIVAIVAVVFLSPVIAIALILGYRMRKARMLNETMLKLAEKGIVPSAEVLEAAGAGRAALPAGSAAGPIYERAKELRERTAWSDLRKGVVMGAIGTAITVYTTMDDHSPNIIGLVLLFVGIGYVALWWFEQRHLAPRSRDMGNPPGPGGTL